MKLETWFRMANLAYETVPVTPNNIGLAPKGKIPFIKYQGELIGDSTLIIEMFKKKEGIDLDQSLTSTERAISLGFRRMLEENTYWGLIYIRYNIQENWQRYQELMASRAFPDVPKEEWQPLLEEYGNNIRTQIYAQGMSRHSSEEIFLLITTDFQALSDFLADKPFFLGEQPTTLDATAYAYIGHAIKPPFAHPVVDYVLQLDNLCQYYERMTKQFFING
jgi:glutathione S-transferase